MTFDKPSRPTKQPSSAPQKTNLATQKVVPNPVKKVIPNIIGGGGNSGNKGGGVSGGGGNGGNNQEPSPWLMGESPKKIDPSASFVEYLRWMRSLDQGNKDGTKIQILQLSEDKADYSKRLAKLTERTKRIAGEGNYFQVKCPWRIRVGGHRGPESILLPAFDALGMPFIPSSTLRGVARAEALRQLNNDEKEVEKFFGSLDAKDSDRMGKIVFLDAYPMPSRDDKSGGLTVDMANNIWTWNGDRLDYAPNPNPFLSLQEPIFLIGIRAASTVSDDAKKSLIDKVMGWLTAGLKNGAGSQVNSGYGALIKAGESDRSTREFVRVEFGLEGQLIHGRQKFTQWTDRRNEYQMRGQAEAEVRPIAFKSMLRYWFRAFALGLIPANQVNQVKEWEGKLFGSLEIEGSGWVQVRILEGAVVQKEPRSNIQGRDDKCGEQAGILTLSHSIEPNAQNPENVEKLFRSLTWLMFNLGGIGQGARRPCYSRKTRDRAPWYRGSTFFIDSKDDFWQSPDGVKDLQNLYQSRIKDFADALRALNQSGRNTPDAPAAISGDRWREAVDANCRIVLCGGDEDYGKPYALAVLHSQEFKVTDRRGEKTYDGNLCGVVGKEVKPSPVWIADLGDYQVVTVFGATQGKRKDYLDILKKKASEFATIYPLETK
ncbi:MAG: RAMP superfamily CRISPR-associated protein [Pseudanabaena sp. Salubria-1]|nr:RAMP superfamily CRISPR-associated protein [Pseudanabaena sp. Salubria-1]